MKLQQIPVLQCDGSVKMYNDKPWWLNTPAQAMNYPAHHTQRKHDKISKTMSDIEAINREAHLDSLLVKGIVRRTNETGIVTIREVAEKIKESIRK